MRKDNPLIDAFGYRAEVHDLMPARMAVKFGNVMLMGRIQWAMFNAQIACQGRDRRRVKREVNRAAKAASRAMRADR